NCRQTLADTATRSALRALFLEPRAPRCPVVPHMVVTGTPNIFEGSRMAAPSSGNPWTSFRRLLAAHDPPDAPDRERLGRFLNLHDEDAFAALVYRHSAMVLAACRRVLHNPHDAEDACQATFLILARKAAAIRKRDAVGSWLHGVAVRVARDLRAK